jgi:Fe-S cluster assembly iron-binding protein IscA
LGLALDEPKETDDIFQKEGFEVIVEKDLLKKIQGVNIDLQKDWKGSQFLVNPIYQVAGSCC